MNSVNDRIDAFSIRAGLSAGQVLQRRKNGASARLSGTAPADGDIHLTVTASGSLLPGFDGIRAGRSAGGTFTAKLEGLPAGGPYGITLECRYARGAVAMTTVSNVWVGDLWLLAGQSNMEGIGVIERDTEIDERIRCLTMARVWETARDPLHFLPESPDPVHNGGNRLSPSAAAAAKKRLLRGSGPGFWFAREMLSRTGVPQGLIATAHGGTSMAQWSPDLSDRGGESLYGSMLLSLRASAQPLSGVLWYQGCSDTNPEDAAAYTDRMALLVAAVRRDTGLPRLPWIVAQIARESGRKEGCDSWSAVTERQRLLPQSIPHLETVPTLDLEMDDWIHISTPGHRILAARFADMAERLAFGNKDRVPAPQPVAARFVKDPLSPVVEVTVRNAVGGLSSPGRAVGYALRTGDGRVLKAVYQARFSGSKIRLRLTMDELSGCSVVHGWGCDPETNTFDSRGWPLPSFGPLPIENLPPISPWFRSWEATDLAKGEDISVLALPPKADFPRLKRLSFPDWWKVDMESRWKGKSGHAIFFAGFTAEAAFEGHVLLGYDGPFRLWVDGEEIHSRFDAPWPREQDSVRVPIALAAGRHEVTVAMATGTTPSGGFFLRLSASTGDGAIRISFD